MRRPRRRAATTRTARKASARTRNTSPETSEPHIRNHNAGTTTRHALTVNEQYSESIEKMKQTSIILISSSHQTTTNTFNDSSQAADYDSTGSTPKDRNEKMVKRVPASERRACKYKLDREVGSASEPPTFKVDKGKLGEDQYQKLKKNLFCEPEDTDDKDFYINFHPNKTVGYERCATIFRIPEWIQMTFRPPSKMTMNNICAYTCAYLFMPKYEVLYRDEDLIKTTTGVVADRAALNSLVPRTAVDQQVINLVVERANWMIDGIGTSKTVWVFPTEFAQFALNPHYETKYVLDMYKNKYMSTDCYISKIFIPLNDQGVHWYLLVVDFFEKKLIWLDSLRSDERRRKRRHVILKMAMFIEDMLHEDGLADLRPHIAHKIVTEFCLDEHSTPRQRIGSNDCGVWVAKWIIECSLMRKYSDITVNTVTRMKLALYLVHSGNNLLLDEVVAKAARYWILMEKRRKALVNI